MDVKLNAAVAVVGLVAWAVAYPLGRRPATDPWLFRLIYFLAVPFLFQVGYALIFMALGFDRWNDSSAWYWDTWVGLGAATFLALTIAISRFRGASRVVFTLLSVGWIAYPLWFHLRA